MKVEVEDHHNLVPAESKIYCRHQGKQEKMADMLILSKTLTVDPDLECFIQK